MERELEKGTDPEQESGFEFESEMKQGFTKRAIAIIILVAAGITPGMTYFGLTFAFVSLNFNVTILLIVFAEIANAYHKPLSPQEAFLISTFAPMALTGVGFGSSGFWTGLIQNHYYFANQPILEQFGFADQLPWWYRIPSSFPGQTFIDPVWIIPVFSSLILFITNILIMYSTGFISFKMQGHLDFPLQRAGAEGLIILVDSKPTRKKLVMYTSASIAAGIAFLVYFFPNVFPGLFPWQFFYTGFGYTRMMPMIDLAPALEIMGLSGASFALPIDPFSYAAGFVLPIKYTLIIFLTNFAIYFVGNFFLVLSGEWVGGIGGWLPGSSTVYNVSWSTVRFWSSIQIGVGFCVAIIPILRHPNSLIDLFRKKGKDSKDSSRMHFPDMKILVGIYILATSVSIVLINYLMPDYPVWILIIFMGIWPLIGSLIATQVTGITSQGFSVPAMELTLTHAVGYKNLDAFLLTGSYLNLNNLSGAGFASTLKQLTITGTRVKDYLKAYALVIVLSAGFGFVFMELFWRSAPIPSATFPATIRFWPLSAMFRAQSLKFVIEGGLQFRPELIVGSFVVTSIIYLATDFIGKGSFLLPVAMAGIGALPAGPIGMVIGSIIANKVFTRFMGEESWLKYRSAIVTGISIGSAAVMVLTSAVMIIGNSLLAMPY
jgi:hypothetical protein